MMATTQKLNTDTAFVWHTDNLAQATKGSWNTDCDIRSQRICTDTRSIQAGDIFLAIKGDNFDGHSYLEKAQELGAIASIVSDTLDIDFPQLVVADTKLALGNLGRFVRDSSPELQVVAITGSSGKTTTKEMLGSIFNQQAPTLVTRGNLNNDLGVPMMLLELTCEQKFAVLELGANHVGEIAYTTTMVNPNVACVLNIGTAHLGEFGGRANICHAKAEIFQSLTNEKFAVVPKIDDYAQTLKTKALEYTQNVYVFGEDISAKDVTVSALYSSFTLCFNTDSGMQEHAVKLNFAGKHNVQNALAAASCAYALGLAPKLIADGLNKAVAPKGRLNHIDFKAHTLIDDTYNANPDAALAAADVLVQTAQETQQETVSVMVLGDIGELGEEAQQEHHKLGEKLAQKNIDILYCVGELMAHCAQAAQDKGANAQHFADKAALASALQTLMNNGSVTALFKGSRFMTMETVIHEITNS